MSYVITLKLGRKFSVFWEYKHRQTTTHHDQATGNNLYTKRTMSDSEEEIT